jgi:hypothetical protein
MNAWRRVWGAHALGDPRPSIDAAHDPSGRLSIDPPPVDSHEDRPVAAFADRQIDGPGRPGRHGDGYDLAALTHNGERAVAALEPEVSDVGAGGFGDSQSVEGEQADQRVISGAGQSCGDQHGADLVAVQASGVGLVVRAGSTHMRRW